MRIAAGCRSLVAATPCSRLLRRLQPAHDLLHGVGLHLLQQPLLLRLAREHLRFVERVAAPDRDLARRQPVAAVGVVDAEGDALGQQVLAHAAAARQRQHVLVVDDAGDVENRLRLGRAVDDLRRAAAFERALQLEGERRRRRRVDVERRERVGDVAAQMEAAAGESAGDEQRGETA